MLKSRKPVLYVGGGLFLQTHRRSSPFLQKSWVFCNHDPDGIGSSREPSPRSGNVGDTGLIGPIWRSWNLTFLIAIGSRFVDRVTGKIEAFAPQAKIISYRHRFDLDQKNVRVDSSDRRGCKRILSKILSLKRKEIDASRGDWINRHHQIDKFKASTNMNYEQKGMIKPQYVIEAIMN